MQSRLKQIWYLALANNERKYVRTRLGFAWLIIQPALTFTIFYVVSVYGFKMGSGGGDAPYFAVLFCGLLPWMTLSEAVHGATSSLPSGKVLLYERSASPTVLIMSSTLASILMHIPLFLIVALILWIGHVPVTASWLAVAYYFLCLSALSCAVSLVVAPAAARSHDVGQVINSLLLVWFWSSPIIWSPKIVPANVLAYLQLNPLFFIVESYRGALLHGQWLSAGWLGQLVFWGAVVIVGALGVVAVRTSEPKLREWLT
jgi:ABC-type polysaccharide/polyol phosphate export permease